MKKLLLTLLLILSLGVLFVGCGSTDTTTEEDTEVVEDTMADETTDTTEDSALIGSWSATSVDNDIEEEVTLTLNEDGTFELLEMIDESGTGVNDIPMTGKFESTDDTLTLVFDEPADVKNFVTADEDTSEFTYKIDGDVLELTGKDDQVIKMNKVETTTEDVVEGEVVENGDTTTEADMTTEATE